LQNQKLQQECCFEYGNVKDSHWWEADIAGLAQSAFGRCCEFLASATRRRARAALERASASLVT